MIGYLRTCVSKQPIIVLYFEFEIVLHVYFMRPLASAHQGRSFGYTTNRHEITVG